MDMIQIGRFLSQLRHEQGWTQEQLGERLGVTNKTVSRWETGQYLPPVEALQAMSDLYGVSINEMVSGRRLEDREFRAAAEENVIGTLRTSVFSVRERMAFFKRKWKRDHAFELTVEMLLLLAALVAGCVWWNELSIVACIVGMVWGVVQYNRMMAYVERQAFDGSGEKE